MYNGRNLVFQTAGKRLETTYESLSLLLFTLLLVVGVAVACQNGSSDSIQNTTSEITEDADMTTSAETAPETYADLRPAFDVPADAASLDALISSIDGATLENEDKIDRAYLGYWSLSEEERARVTGYETLQTLRTELLKAYVVKEYMDTRMPHHKFLIGIYTGPADANEQAVKELADAYINMVWHAGSNSDIWSLLNKHDIGMFNNVGYHRDENGGIIDAPNLWLLEGRDEPDANAFDELAALGNQMKEILPECGYTNNLFPNHATNEQLGGTFYKAYLQSFVEKTPTDIVCYDHYPYTANVRTKTHLRRWLNNLVSVRDVCLDNGKDMYVIAQLANDDLENGYITLDQMRFQAFSAMTFGAKSISWWLYSNWIWAGTVYDNGIRTEQYEKMVEVNTEIKSLEPIFMRYTTSGIGYLFNKPVKGEVSDTDFDFLTSLRETGMKKIDKSVVTDFTVEGSDLIQVGQFKKNVGEGTALMLLNVTDFTYENKTTAKVTFTAVDYSAVVTAYVKGIPTILDPDENGVYTVEVSGADAVFLTFD